MRSGRLGRRRRRSKRRRSLAPELSLIQVMTPTPTPREEPHASPTRAAHPSQKGKGDYRIVSHDYTFQIPSEHNASIHMGKPPFFDGTGYNQWKTKMFGYLNAIHKDLWKVVEVGCEIPDEDETPTPVQSYVMQRNFQALNILHTSVCPEEFDKIEDAPTAKDAWDTLQVNHQGSRKVRESRIKTLEDELSLFSMKKDENVKEMYNRMKKIANQIKSLGGDK